MPKESPTLCGLPILPSPSSPLAKKRKEKQFDTKTGEKKPGDGVSVDHIVSTQPGLIPQMSGFITNQRLWGATTFVDH